MASDQQDSAQLTIGGDEYNFPIVTPTMGKKMMDISKLNAQTDLFTIDGGFKNTGSCESKITFIDGSKGQLLYRGYLIEELAEKSDFMEVCYLLLNGELPNKKEKEEFTTKITRHTMVHEQMRTLLKGFRRDAHPMAVMCGMTASLSAFYHDSLDIHNEEHRELAAIRLIAKVITLAAWAHKHTVGLPITQPDNSCSYAGNFLKMTFGVPCEDYDLDPKLAQAMDKIFILHADHEQNCSTSTVRLAGSSGANPFACIAAGIAALWGPLHGGANQAVLEMLAEIGDVKRIPEFVKRAKDKSDPFRLMGFGHRVYKNFDPRAKVMQKTCHEVLDITGQRDNEALKIAMELERIALEDEYFIEKKLYPNIDFYSGITLKAMGIPVEMFTVIFAIGRMPGWLAQWKEMIEMGDVIGRPRQLYTGYTERPFVPVDKR